MLKHAKTQEHNAIVFISRDELNWRLHSSLQGQAQSSSRHGNSVVALSQEKMDEVQLVCGDIVLLKGKRRRETGSIQRMNIQ